MSGQLDFGKAGIGRESRRATVDFTIDCNTPFIYRLSAQEGAMRLQSSGPAATPAHARLPYDVSLTIPTDDGGTLRASCGSDRLRADTAQACDADSSHAVAMNKRGQLVVKLQPAAEVQVAGQYSDSIQIIIDIKQ